MIWAVSDEKVAPYGVTVELPAYYDALTRDGSATVLLTAKGPRPYLLSYDGFNEKSFRVHGTEPSGEFDWEVKAVRADVPALRVEQWDPDLVEAHP
ncbi:MAG: hypothetical protein NDI61_13585 [Bdellovibrionaceae bacterium]|nr:hypothetical protein [Pseudobdellovibrionaceae bacterium]